MQQLSNTVFPKQDPRRRLHCWCRSSGGKHCLLPHSVYVCATKDVLWDYGVIRGWPGHNALQSGVIMTWPWYHNAGQTMTYLKNSQKTGQTAANQPVWPSLSVHVVFFFFSSCFPSSISLIQTFPHFFSPGLDGNAILFFILFLLNGLHSDTFYVLFLTLSDCLSLRI